MGEMSEFWKDGKEAFQQRCEKRNNNFEPRLIKIGAMQKSNAVYEIDGFFCYPTKGFAMNKRNSDERYNLNKFLLKYENTSLSTNIQENKF